MVISYPQNPNTKPICLKKHFIRPTQTDIKIHWDESEVDFLTKALESKVTKEVTISYNGDGHESLDYVDKDGWQHNIWGDKFKATTDSP